MLSSLSMLFARKQGKKENEVGESYEELLAKLRQDSWVLFAH